LFTEDFKNSKTMRLFSFIFIFFILITSCFHTQDTSSASMNPARLNYISSAKKMVEVKGGIYMAFIGKDSGRIVEVKSFYMDETPVTVSEYLKFLKANPQWTKSKIPHLYADSSYLHNWKGDFEPPAEADQNAPVTNISWFAAQAYAKSVGKRLPMVDEWEFVALADETSKNASAKPEFTNYILKSYQNKKNYLNPVRQETPNYYGVYNLYGMIWEWTEDFNSVMMSGESRNDKTTNETLFCSGAAVTTDDLKNYAAFIRFAMRGSLKANYTVNNLGFRCVKNLESNSL